MNTRFLETFIWLARLKSFSRTAERMHASQPAVSGRIVALEELLGVTLYERSSKGFELTAAGRRILDRCEQIVQLSKELKSIASEDNVLGRPVRIGASDVITLSWMGDLTAVLASKYVDYQFDIVTDSANNLSRMLMADEIDIALVANGIDESRIVNAPLCNYRVEWLANPRKFDVAKPINIEQLCEMPIIMPPRGTPGYNWQVGYLKRHNPNYSPDRPSPLRISCGYSPATGIQMVAQGFGVLPVPLLLARPWIASGEVAPLKVRESFPAWAMNACYKSPPTIPIIVSLVETAQAVAKAFADRRGGSDFWP
ncbi:MULTISPECIES: LysR family transcriptional regulator [unclassified Sphingomonas]|uniref:LysR family transcriptional regulator n=1 Tax=unclassified Sphingomonas TaxID=196159 RepID=UPI0006F6FC96|nr:MULTISPECIES: LysR family transcriptional regulator [unclassified Sphingomonas]KQX19970.1 LysR family transcriptional regulator [Sphingomonas sp. Root1294]KQY67217.1 LysR family transcriptional regulator [Sphingomonas sp. Root50]KRB90591.1 LysR family transcriptional regulator [Sphingomonas sp. Root720]